MNARRLEWPGDLLDVAAVRSAGWRPHPFRQFVLKIHSRCNLACDYCYVYELADQTWRDRPKTMAPHIKQATVARIAEHVREHGLRKVKVILHGGEPLLAGSAFIADLADQVRAALPGGTLADLVVQTNGTLLDERMLDVLLRSGIRVGVSIDGDRAATDRYRLYPNGRSSHDEVARALGLLQQEPYRAIYAGLLCTIALANDPIQTYETLLGHAPPVIDLLLPHGTWSAPPPSRPPDESTPYADWLLAVYSRWANAPRKETSIRLFESIIWQLLGGQSRTETIGLAPGDVIVIEADGEIRQSGALSAAYDDAAGTGYNVVRHPLDAALDHPTTVARQIGIAALCATCRRCTVRDTCGGGFYPHRYRSGEGFRNASVYCADLLRLITEIDRHVNAELSRLGELAGPSAAGIRPG